ncbi:MAG TPA: hypothetical protein VF701_06230 [Thermoanaerobaculia bacterium]
MSKHTPNQDFYKIGGRDHSEGPDKAVVTELHRQKYAESEKDVKRNFIPGEAPVGETSADEGEEKSDK